MQEINFNQLKRIWNLKLVFETGSIKKAAVRANVTSSAMSQSISGLELELGRKVLLRTKDNIAPTEYGLQLLRSADAAFKTCREFQKGLMEKPQTCPPIDWLDFAVTDSLAIEILPSLMQRLRLQLPHIRLKVKSGKSSTLTQLVKKTELCMALVEENDFREGVVSIPLAEDRLGFYCSSHESVQKLKNRAMDKLGIGMISAGAEGHPRYFSKFINAYAKGLKPTLISDSYELLRGAAVEGSVVAILPARVAQRRSGELIELFPEGKSSEKSDIGRYKIYLVSEPACTTEENSFLSREIISLLSAISEKRE